MAVERWSGWVSELERHPLDRLEYGAILDCRDAIVTEVEVAGSQRLFADLDEIDARFVACTAESIDSPFSHDGDGWWRSRLPSGPESLAYVQKR